MKDSLVEIFTLPYSEHEQAYESRNSIAPHLIAPAHRSHASEKGNANRFARFGD